MISKETENVQSSEEIELAFRAITNQVSQFFISVLYEARHTFDTNLKAQIYRGKNRKQKLVQTQQYLPKDMFDKNSNMNSNRVGFRYARFP